MEFKLILKKLNNTLTEEEATVFSEWYNESEQHKVFFNKVKSTNQDETLLVDVEKGWKSIENQINPVPVKKINYLKYAVAAAVLLIVSITILNKRNNVKEVIAPLTKTKSIKIGSDKATLTLADGHTINLENGKPYISKDVKSNGAELVYKASNVQNSETAYNYLTIPRGGKYHIILADGTEAWLNSESQLKYPTNFINGKTREIELVYGEAYFEVSPSTKHEGAKFKVVSGVQNIEVLGTKFNIKAYKDEKNIYTTLVEGKVKVGTASNDEVLKPNDQSILNKENKNIIISKVDVYSEIAWKRGVFSFQDKSLKEIMKTLSRWYDVDIVFEDKSLEDIRFKGALNKNQDIEEFLKLIKNTNFIHAYEIKNNTIIIKN